MCEPRGELLHLACRSGHLFFNQHLEIGADHFVPIGIGGFAIAATLRILRDLAEDPRIRRSGAADHHSITVGLCHHGAGVFRHADVAIADHRNLHCLLDRANPVPARLTAVTLFACTGVQRNRAQATIFRHFRQFDADNLLIIPSRAEFDGKRNLHCRAHRFKNTPYPGQVAQQPRATVALDNLFRRAAQVEVYEIETQILDHASGICNHWGTAAEKLR